VSRELGLARAKGLAEAFELLGSAAVILDWRGEVILVNRVAERTLTRELRIARRRLTVATPDAGARLARLVGQVTSVRTEPAPGPPVVVERAGRRPLLIYAVPLASEGLDIFSNARALLIVLDPEARPVPPEDALRGAFGMTTAEARLASQLAGGESLEAAADALGITKQTARTHLKAVFAKAGTHRQSELVALLGRLAGGRPEISSV
jgi:DNA-binding CsgD family transcriptional regulator